jgi:hypothetical protein
MDTPLVTDKPTPFPVGYVDDTPREAAERARWSIESEHEGLERDGVVARSPSGWIYRVRKTAFGPVADPIEERPAARTRSSGARR